MANQNEKEMTFWDHLDELRKIFFRIVIVIVVFACISFVFKDFLFNIIFAPQRSDFVLYRFFNQMAEQFKMPSLAMEEFQVELINTQLTSQFMTHMTISLYSGILLASPYIIYTLFQFISPALYTSERQICLKILTPACLLFILGVLLSYYIIFPLSFRFLATYQVSTIVTNMISLTSYISSLVMLSLLLGVAFEIPIIVYLLSKLKLIQKKTLKKFRKHALIVILILASIITPTSDIFTLLLVSTPLYLLYEFSIIVASRTNSR